MIPIKKAVTIENPATSKDTNSLCVLIAGAEFEIVNWHEVTSTQYHK